MTVKTAPYYWAACDAPDCDAETRTDDNIVYDDAARLQEQFEERSWGNLRDDYGWLEADGKHYCGHHTFWDDDADVLVPDPDGSLRAADHAAFQRRAEERNS